MEWQSISIPDYPNDQYWFNSSVAETEAAQYTDVGWSFQENKCFEKALADFNGIASPAFFEHVEFKMPWKSHEDIDFHYQALLKDIEDIESSEFVFEDIYKAKKSTKIDEHQSSSILSQQFQWASNLSQKDREHQSSSILSKQKNKIRKQSRTRSGPWTEHEHKLFLMGLKEFGEGKWTSVCEHYVKTRTPTQVTSHAQKYKLRQTSKTPKDRRKPSIHDIKLIDGNNVTFTANNHNNV